PIDANGGPTNVDPHIAAIGPTQLRKGLPERKDAKLRRRIVFVEPDEHADAPYAVALLRLPRERPSRGRAAECSQQLPPSDGACHTPLPREVRKGNDTTPRACCPNSMAPGEDGGARQAQALLREIYLRPRRFTSPRILREDVDARGFL